MTPDILKAKCFNTKEPRITAVSWRVRFQTKHDQIDGGYRLWTYSRKPSAGGKQQYFSKPSGDAIDGRID